MATGQSLADQLKKLIRICEACVFWQPKTVRVESKWCHGGASSRSSLRAPGNQLLQRVKTEAAAGKLMADVIDHSDRSLMFEIENLFPDYAPPNAADYIPETRVSPKLWPRSTVVWAIAYNSELVKNPPKSWMDLTKTEYGASRSAT